MTASIKTALVSQIKKAAERELKPSSHFRMSSLGHCPRKQVAMRAGLKPTEEWDTRTEFKMWTGTVLGHEIQRLLESGGFLDPAWTEKEVTYRSYVGHVDGKTDRLPCGPTIVECKTSDDNAVTKPDWPQHYQWQGLGYCLATGFKQVLVFQLGKNQGLSRDCVFYLTEAWTREINAHIDLLEHFWTDFEVTKELPPHHHQFGWEDKTCAY